MGRTISGRRDRPQRAITVVLGINEIASAIAVKLHRHGYGVVMCHDPVIPVIRRGMAFHDALYGDCLAIDGISAVNVDTAADARFECQAHERIAVTRLGLPEIIVMGTIDALIDARMLKHGMKPDLRHLARITVGLGPGFAVGENCDVAVETKPVGAGQVLEFGRTQRADGVSRRLGNAGAERFVYCRAAGRWRTGLEFGQRVFKGFALGRLGAEAVLAPMDGILRGIARDNTDVPANVKLIEIDPRGRAAQWVGIDDRGAVLAAAALRAVLPGSSDVGERGRIGKRRGLKVISDE